MPTRALRLVSLPMLALLLAIPASAHATAGADVDDTSINCNHDHDDIQTPAVPLFVPSPTNPGNATDFSATLPLPAGTKLTARIAVCRANLTLVPSPDGAAHLAVSFPRPLPGGRLASAAVHQFALADSHLTVSVDIPTGESPHIQLSLPLGTATDLAVVHGDLALTRLLGESHIAIVKGDATLHLADADFSSLECATVMGGVRDRRPGGGSHGHLLSTWSTHGSGSAKVEISAVSGNVILLLRTD